MSFTARLSVFCLLTGIALLVVGTRKVRNRRLRHFLRAPDPKCCGERLSTECAGKVS